MRPLLIATLLLGCERSGERKPDPPPPADAAVPVVDVCPPEGWRDPIVRRAVWPRCPIDPPFTTPAARCATRGCMRPCAREDGFAGKPPDKVFSYRYDEAGRLIEQRISADGEQRSMTCSYDGDRVRSCVINQIAEDVYEYEAGRVARIRYRREGKDFGLYTYAYDGDRLVQATVKIGSDPGTVETYGYDAQGRLIRVGDRVDAPDQDEQVEHLSYDPLGRLVGTREEWRSPGGKITPSSQYGTQTLTYDANGRVANTTYGIEPADKDRNRMTHAYDATGRLVSTSRTDGYVFTYRYDCR